jgi:hypothetical protein
MAYLFMTTRTRQLPSGSLSRHSSGGVFSSWPWQNGHLALVVADDLEREWGSKSVGRRYRRGATITQFRVVGSWRSSDCE